MTAMQRRHVTSCHVSSIFPPFAFVSIFLFGFIRFRLCSSVVCAYSDWYSLMRIIIISILDSGVDKNQQGVGLDNHLRAQQCASRLVSVL